MNGIARRLRTSRKAAIIHLGSCAIVAAVCMLLIFRFWYPWPLSVAQGVSHLVLIMIGVDVVIGPLITSIIYDPEKKWLRFDLAIIVLLQTTALLYGMKAIYGGRPAYVVFNVDRFDLVAVQDINRDSLARVPADLAPSFWGPVTVGARLPLDPERRGEIMFSAVSGGADLPQLPEYYVPLDSERGNMLKHLHPLSELRKINELDDENGWSKILKTFGKPEAELGYLPLNSNAKDGAVILDAQTGEMLGIRMLIPRFESPATG